MKKYLYVLLLVFGNAYSQKEKLINYTWVLDYYIIEGTISKPGNKNIDDKIIFNSDNTFSLIEEGESLNGTWTYIQKKNTIKIKMAGFPIEMPLKIKLLNEHTFAWESIDDETGLKKITYMKKL
jgi:hypothetical protein